MTPYLTVEHAPVTGEHTVDGLRVRGAVPDGLRGTFARNSGNPAFGPGPRHHWFDGDGMVHALSFGDDGVAYRNRYVRTAALERERAAGRRLWGGLLELPLEEKGIKDTANTDLVWWQGQLVATWWLTGAPMALDLDLATRGPATAGATPLPRMAAHPKVDPRTGELVFFGFDVFRAPYLRVGVASPDGTVRSWPVDVPHPHVPHDVGITEHYTVVMDFPMGWDPDAMRAGKRRIAFFRDRPARFGVLPRHGGDVRWFEDDACYVYHLVGAWEDGAAVVVVGCRIADPIPADGPGHGAPSLDSIRLEPYLVRWRLDLATGAVTREALDDVPSEFPRADDRRWGLPMRHAYLPRIAGRPGLSFDGVTKLDLESGRRVVHGWDGWLSGEVVFAPRPGGTADDDGWLVTVLTHPSDGRSEGVVLDARELVELARIELPVRVPLGFHAEWVPAG